MSKRSAEGEDGEGRDALGGRRERAGLPLAIATRSGSTHSLLCSAKSSRLSGLPAADTAATMRRAMSPP